MRRFKSSAHPAFTLIELLVSIAIISILTAAVMVSINPARQLGTARDAERQSDVNTILNAVTQYTIDHDGQQPALIPTNTPKVICQTGLTGTACTNPPINGVDLSSLTGSYVVHVPVDPLVTQTATGTAYYIWQDADRHITVTAPRAETQTITVMH